MACEMGGWEGHMLGEFSSFYSHAPMHGVERECVVAADMVVCVLTQQTPLLLTTQQSRSRSSG